MEVLSACLSAVQSFFEVWFSLPPGLYFSLSIVHFGQMTRALLVASKLCLFDGEDWDLSHVRGSIHISNIIEEMANRMEEASTTFGRERHISPLALSARNLRLGKTWYEAKLAASMVAVDPHAQMNRANADNIVIGNQFDIWGDDLWGGFTTNWDMVP
jgi:hypothetical protein